MNAESRIRNPRLTPDKARLARRLSKEGLTYQAIAEQMGVGYWQVANAVKRGSKYNKKKAGYTRKVRGPYKKKVAVETPEQNTDYKQLYLKAVALLVEHGILEVTL